MALNKEYSFWTAAVFMISINSGLGLLALPHALAGTGWFGVCFILLASVNSCYSSILLGETWLMIENQCEEYRDKYRSPYPVMGMKALGIWMRYVVTATLNISAIGLVTVYLLMSAQVGQFMLSTYISLDYKFWIIILAIILCPLTWFGSIEKFQFAGIGALLTIVFACAAAFIGALLDYSKTEEHKRPTFESVSLSFGTILFAYGCIFFYPTVQNGMKNKKHYYKAALLANLALLFMYVPLAAVGFAVYGTRVNPNIVLSIKNKHLQIFIQICLAAHCFLAYLLGINPVMQDAEEVLRIPKVFNYKRCLVRTFITFVTLAIAYTVPHFDKIMDLIGGSTMTLLTFIFPSLFFSLVSRQDSKLKDTQTRISILETLFQIQIVLVGIAGGISCTYFAVLDIARTFGPKQTIFNITM